VSTYEIGLLGDITPTECDQLIATVTALVSDFQLTVGRDVMIRTSELFRERQTHSASAIAYFGGAAQIDQELARHAFDSSLPIIPTIPSDGEFHAMVPPFLQASNCYAGVRMIPRCWSWRQRFWNASGFSDASGGYS
jgi:hypothetical protein